MEWLFFPCMISFPSPGTSQRRICGIAPAATPVLPPQLWACAEQWVWAANTEQGQDGEHRLGAAEPFYTTGLCCHQLKTELMLLRKRNKKVAISNQPFHSSPLSAQSSCRLFPLLQQAGTSPSCPRWLLEFQQYPHFVPPVHMEWIPETSTEPCCKHLYPQLTLKQGVYPTLLLLLGMMRFALRNREGDNFCLFLNFSSLSFLYHFIDLFYTSDEAQRLPKFSSQGREWEGTVHLRAAKGSWKQAQGEFSHSGEENPKSSTQKRVCSALFLLRDQRILWWVMGSGPSWTCYGPTFPVAQVGFARSLLIRCGVDPVLFSLWNQSLRWNRCRSSCVPTSEILPQIPI